MTTLKKADICFQCGKERITTKVYEEYVNNSLVVSTESVCSDPACQKRTEELIRKEKARREEAGMHKKEYGNKRNAK